MTTDQSLSAVQQQLNDANTEVYLFTVSLTTGWPLSSKVKGHIPRKRNHF